MIGDIRIAPFRSKEKWTLSSIVETQRNLSNFVTLAQ
jgi:hypothetical protein